MNTRILMATVIAAGIVLAVGSAWAQPAPDESPAAANGGAPATNQPESQSGTTGLGIAVAVAGLALGAGLVVFSGARGIGLLGSHAVEAIARQPEAAGTMFLAWLFPAAMIEGATLFALVILYLVLNWLGTL